MIFLFLPRARTHKPWEVSSFFRSRMRGFLWSKAKFTFYCVHLLFDSEKESLELVVSLVILEDGEWGGHGIIQSSHQTNADTYLFSLSEIYLNR